jgi:translation elongation factor EF-4
LAAPDALAKKMSAKIGFSVPDLGVDKLITTILTPAGDTDGKIGADLTSTANAFWAGVLVLLLMFVVVGCVRLASGSRGAGEKLALVFGGAILLIAAVGVFQ